MLDNFFKNQILSIIMKLHKIFMLAAIVMVAYIGTVSATEITVTSITYDKSLVVVGGEFTASIQLYSNFAGSYKFKFEVVKDNPLSLDEVVGYREVFYDVKQGTNTINLKFMIPGDGKYYIRAYYWDGNKWQRIDPWQFYALNRPEVEGSEVTTAATDPVESLRYINSLPYKITDTIYYRVRYDTPYGGPVYFDRYYLDVKPGIIYKFTITRLSGKPFNFWWQKPSGSYNYVLGKTYYTLDFTTTTSYQMDIRIYCDGSTQNIDYTKYTMSVVAATPTPTLTPTPKVVDVGVGTMYYDLATKKMSITFNVSNMGSDTLNGVDLNINITRPDLVKETHVTKVTTDIAPGSTAVSNPIVTTISDPVGTWVFTIIVKDPSTGNILGKETITKDYQLPPPTPTPTPPPYPLPTPTTPPHNDYTMIMLMDRAFDQNNKQISAVVRIVSTTSQTLSNVQVSGVFHSPTGKTYQTNTATISTLDPYKTRDVILTATVDTPENGTWLLEVFVKDSTHTGYIGYDQELVYFGPWPPSAFVKIASVAGYSLAAVALIGAAIYGFSRFS